MEKKLEIKDYLEIIWRRKWFFIIPFVVITIIAGAYFKWSPRIYEASTTLIVEHADLYRDYVRPTIVETGPEERFKTLVQQITSRNFLEKIVEEFKLIDKQEQGTSLGSVIDSLKNRIKVRVTGEIVIESFNITYEDQDPVMSMKITNRLADLFIERNQQQRENHALKAISFLDKELKRVQSLLKYQERKMAEFRALHFGMLPENSQVVTTTPPVDLTESDDVVVLYSELRRLQLKYTDEHPEIIRLKAKIAELESKRESNSNSDITPITPVKKVEQNRLKVQQEWQELTLNYQVTQTELQSLLDKKHQAELAASMEQTESGYRIQILDEATIPEAPSKPNLQQIILAWLLLSLGAGVGLVAVKERSDTSFYKIEELEEFTELPVVANISKIKKKTFYKTLKKFTELLAVIASSFKMKDKKKKRRN
jgi:succinoglycan biosynthesis transport protein ExoP